VARLKRWFSLFFVFGLGTLASINHFIAPSKDSAFGSVLADESYRPELAMANAAELARPTAARLSDIKAPIAARSRSEEENNNIGETDKMIDRLDSAEDALLGRSNEVQVHDSAKRDFAKEEQIAKRADDERLEAALESNRTLQAQQETLIQEIGRLRRVASQRVETPAVTAPVADTSALEEENKQLKEQLQTITERAEKERGNVKLLADHILKLRQNLKAAQDEIAKKSSELDAFNHTSDLTEKLNSEKNELTAEKTQLGTELDKVRNQYTTLKQSADTVSKMNQDLSAEKAKLTAELDGLKRQREATLNQLDDAKNHAADLEDGLKDLRAKLAQADADRKAYDAKLASKDEEFRVQEEELEDTKRQLSRTINEVGSCSTSLNKQEKVASGVPQLQKEVAELKAAVAARETDIKSLKDQLQSKEEVVNGIPALKKELLAVKTQLVMKDRELKLMNGGAAPAPAAATPSSDTQAEQDRILEQSGRIAGKEALNGKSSTGPSDVLIVEVIGDRVALRSGPSQEDSEVVPVGKGTRLTVEERIGDWYRVIAPNSTRAYVRADMVRIFTGGESINPPLSRRPAVNQARAPKKRAIQAVPTENMEPFGDVSASSDKIDRAFKKLQSGVDNSKPMPPEVIP